ncbi:hypothetical protein Acr_12g0002660 [Actinidia rufa]|uniref:Retrotransposon gag domain-containing protein n=1 Tax=Actinidia rufa TaxID=165716 RepID=A0A7J0FGD5_9ERIC|nr:hypothetical protein Acr_12g0002660 [Actinidia rufa]
MALCAKNKSGFIDNSLPCPTDEDIKTLWKRVSTMVLSWLLNSINNSITPSLTSCHTPYELWRELESRFTQGNHATIFKIQREISNLEQGNLNITNYYNHFKTLRDQLDSIDPPPECKCHTATAWEKKVSNARVYQLLMGISESYHILRTQILAMDPLPNLGKIYGLLIAEEHTKTPQPVTTIQPIQEDSAMISQKIQPQQNQPKFINGKQRNQTQIPRSFPRNQTKGQQWWWMLWLCCHGSRWRRRKEGGAVKGVIEDGGNAVEGAGEFEVEVRVGVGRDIEGQVRERVVSNENGGGR